MTKTKRPSFLWHAAPECAIDSILAEGLRARPFVYAAQDIGGAWGFMAFRTFDHLLPYKPENLVPEMHHHDTLGMFSIDAKMAEQLTGEKWEPSFDHDPSVFGDAWLLRAPVPAAALTLYRLNREGLEVHPELTV